MKRNRPEGLTQKNRIYLVGESGKIVRQVEELSQGIFRVLVKLLQHRKDQRPPLLFGSAQQGVEEAVEGRRMFALLEPKASRDPLRLLQSAGDGATFGTGNLNASWTGTLFIGRRLLLSPGSGLLLLLSR